MILCKALQYRSVRNLVGAERVSKDILSSVSEAIANVESELTQRRVHDALSAGCSPIQVLDALRKGLEIVGERYDCSEYFISELVITGQIMKDAVKILEPHMNGKSFAAKGAIVLGSALGDMHDIGKNIVKMMLASQGYEVHDLGVDVPPERFAEKAKEVRAKVVGASALLTTTVPMSADIVNRLEKIGLSSKVKVILGGAAVRPDMVRRYHVDAAVIDVIQGIRIIDRWMAT
jgi:methylmalonyl-CoA mutase cobalamin-binding domain/chain